MAIANSKSDVMKERGFICTIKMHSKKFALLDKYWEDESLAIACGCRTIIRRRIVVCTAGRPSIGCSHCRDRNCCSFHSAADGRQGFVRTSSAKSQNVLSDCHQSLPSSQRQNEVLIFVFICTVFSLIEMSASDCLTTYPGIDVWTITISTRRHIPGVLVMQIVSTIAL
jgi:hypothetical protein